MYFSHIFLYFYQVRMKLCHPAEEFTSTILYQVCYLKFIFSQNKLIPCDSYIFTWKFLIPKNFLNKYFLCKYATINFGVFHSKTQFLFLFFCGFDTLMINVSVFNYLGAFIASYSEGKKEIKGRIGIATK